MSDKADNCPRRGCGRYVAKGVQCDVCCGWYHECCTGLSAEQYATLSEPSHGFRCMMCITEAHPEIHSSPNHLPPSTPPSTSSAPLMITAPDPTPTPKPPTLTKILNLLEANKTSVTDLTDGIASLTQRMASIEHVFESLPVVRAADDVNKLTSHIIEAAASSQADSVKRAKNLIVRGLPFTHNDCEDTANQLLAYLLPTHPHLRITAAAWFFRKEPCTTRPLRITLATAAQRTAILQSRQIITRCIPGVTIHPDLPISKRWVSKVQPHPSATLSLSPIHIRPSILSAPDPASSHHSSTGTLSPPETRQSATEELVHPSTSAPIDVCSKSLTNETSPIRSPDSRAETSTTLTVTGTTPNREIRAPSFSEVLNSARGWTPQSQRSASTNLNSFNLTSTLTAQPASSLEHQPLLRKVISMAPGTSASKSQQLSTVPKNGENSHTGRRPRHKIGKERVSPSHRPIPIPPPLMSIPTRFTPIHQPSPLFPQAYLPFPHLQSYYHFINPPYPSFQTTAYPYHPTITQPMYPHPALASRVHGI
jgi:hypothetical protein